MFRAAPKRIDRKVFRRNPLEALGPVARMVFLVTLATAGLFGTGCASDKAVISQANQSHAELSKAVVTDPQLAGYIQNVGDRIVASAKRLNDDGYRPKSSEKEDNSWMFSKAMQFHFVNSKTLNAFTTGGEHMYVYTELFAGAKTNMNWPAVMAHEYGHVFGRHIHNGMNRQMWSLVGAGAAGVAGYAAGGEEGAGYGAGAGMALAGLANAGFTRGDEAEADKLGFEFYVHAGWDPDQFAGFFRTILEVEKKAGGGGPEFLSDHPATPSRIKAAEQRTAEWKAKHPDWQQRLVAPVADGSKFPQVIARANEVGRTMPDDKSLDTQKLLAALPRSCLFPDEPQPADAQRAQKELAAKAEKQAAEKKK